MALGMTILRVSFGFPGGVTGSICPSVQFTAVNLYMMQNWLSTSLISWGFVYRGNQAVAGRYGDDVRPASGGEIRRLRTAPGSHR